MKKVSFIGIVILQIFLILSISPTGSFSIGKILNSGIVSAEDSEIGCCVDGVEGLCSPNSEKSKCEEQGGIFEKDSSCAIFNCQKACCVLGSEVEFVTETRCEYLSLQKGLEFDFRQEADNELSCLGIENSLERGACSFGESCVSTSRQECESSEGIFYEGKLCSNVELDSSCEKQSYIGCVEGKEEIYWFDSCGNIENIYSSNKIASWNDGRVLTKNESCGTGDANINCGNCGNCNFGLGSFCSETGAFETSVKDGNFICKSLKCVDENGNERENGESWCVYDSYSGDGKDAVGSRHWRYMCLNGEVVSEGCADYRGQICIQENIENPTNQKNFSVAACVVNQANLCLNYNSHKDTLVENCNSNEQCILKNVDIDDGFKFDFCSPKYPKGLDLIDWENSGSSTSEICSVASQKCTVIYVKSATGKWKCKYNCDCEKQEFSEKMNDWCVSLGDCGSYVNYIGEGTNSANIKNAPKISWEKYVNYSNAIVGKFISIIGENGSLFSVGSVETYEPDLAFQEAVSYVGQISGALGSAATGLAWLDAPLFGLSGVGIPFTPIIQSFGGALSAVAIGYAIGTGLSYAMGIEGEGATIVAIAGSAIVADLTVASYLIYGNVQIMSFCIVNPFACIASAVVLVVIASLVKWMGIGKQKKVIVEFECLPWEPPLGGDDCSKCNSDPLKPCTEYRCESLGMACGLINENSENPECVEMYKDNGMPPEIKEVTTTPEYKFEEIENLRGSIRKSDSSCVTEFQPVFFNLKTDKFSQCKWEFNRTEFYDEMENFALEKNLFSTNHTFYFYMPSIQSVENYYNVTGDLKKYYANIDLFIRCRDVYGNYNKKEYSVNFCVNSGPDLTAPQIIATNPAQNKILKYNTSKIDFDIYVNEPANCRYSFEEGKDYDFMNEMNCLTELDDKFDYGGKCNSSLKSLKQNQSVYIKCKDQPWLPEINKSRNVNSEDFVYSFSVSKEKLKIDSIIPDKGKILEAGYSPYPVEIKVKTSGGAENGKAICAYTWQSNGLINFEKTSSSESSQKLNLINGNYKLGIRCEDVAGNFVYGETEFELKTDEKSPEIIRVVKEGGNLHLTSDEDAKCYFDLESCRFNINDKDPIGIGFSRGFNLEWSADSTYYIKCEDIWGNKNSECGIIVRPEMF